MTKDENKLVVYKSNPVLDMKNEMTLYQQRLFNLYLAAINPLDENTKKVMFSLNEFVHLLGITGVSGKKLHALARETVRMYVDLYALDEEGGKKKADSKRLNYVAMWKRFKVDKNERGEWYVELEAGEEVLPYLFEIKSLGYLNFPVLFALRMRSPIAEKLYEQAARFRDTGLFVISVDELKKRLGVAGKKSYESYNKFKTSVLLRCIEEINEKTDIKLSIAKEERLHRRGSPVRNISFSVEENENFIEEEADEQIRKIYEKNMPIETTMTTMTPVDATADRQISLETYELQEEYGFNLIEAETILADKKKYGLSDNRIKEVIEYAIRKKPDNVMGYIRNLLKRPEADLTGRGGASKNLFNEFMKSDYGDIDELEKELLNEWGMEKQEEKVEQAGLPSYYIVIGSPDVPQRLAAYQALGISGEQIRILTKEEYEKMRGQSDAG